MKCQDYSLLISARLDGRLSLNERQRLEAHLNECQSCRDEAAELADLRSDLRRMAPRLPSPEMAAEIMTVLQMEARLQARAARTREARREAMRVWAFSHSIGFVVSLALLFFLTTAILRPLHRTMAIAQALAETAASEESNKFNELSNLLLPPPPTRPNFSPSGVLLGFSESSPEGEFVVAVVVDKNGTASVREVVEPPSDPAMIARLSDVLTRQASFTPARREGKYIPAPAVLMFGKVNIQG
ncbi:MAG TPA: zf-HC2 domain-containing protein [Blastocatellia bacterium]|nr:zf-HC2 domain-containing protein [Blastocatellia bacterium]